MKTRTSLHEPEVRPRSGNAWARAIIRRPSLLHQWGSILNANQARPTHAKTERIEIKTDTCEVCHEMAGPITSIGHNAGHSGCVPEILEVELYRQAALSVRGRRLRRVDTDDSLVVSDGEEIQSLAGSKVVDVSRHGKLMTIHLDKGSIDLHFGMAGRIVVDGRSPIDQLVYGASDNSRWMRFGMYFDKGFLQISDPRRFSRVSIHAEDSKLGPDALGIDKRIFVESVSKRRGAVKAVLLNQKVIAGLGNMLVDEILFRCNIDPRAESRDLSPRALASIHASLCEVLTELTERGGSHTGDLSFELRSPGALCPQDGRRLSREVVGGRTTFFCAFHQK